jgi:hypothetical protein
VFVEFKNDNEMHGTRKELGGINLRMTGSRESKKTQREIR